MALTPGEAWGPAAARSAGGWGVDGLRWPVREGKASGLGNRRKHRQWEETRFYLSAEGKATKV